MTKKYVEPTFNGHHDIRIMRTLYLHDDKVVAETERLESRKNKESFWAGLDIEERTVKVNRLSDLKLYHEVDDKDLRPGVEINEEDDD